MGSDRHVLVSMPYAGGTAAVGWEDEDGFLWLTGDADRGPGTGLEGYEPAIEGLEGEQMVQGGRLPPGAVGCEVVDDLGTRQRADVGGGAWVIVLDRAADGEVFPVRFFDQEGATVPRPWPAAWPRRHVEDATESCPACDGASWDELRPLDESHGTRGTRDGGWEPSPVVVCCACGHGVSVGSFMTFAGESEDPDKEAQREACAMMERHRRAAREALAQLDFPIYHAAGIETRLLGWGGGESLTRVSVGDAHWNGMSWAPARVEVTTARRDEFDESETTLAREAIQALAFDGSEEWPHRSEAGLSIWLDQQDKARRRRAAETDLDTGTIEIDGTPEIWTVGPATEGWVAVRHHEALTVTVVARSVPLEHVRLERVQEPAALREPDPPDGPMRFAGPSSADSE